MILINISLNDRKQVEAFVKSLDEAGVNELIEKHGGGYISYQRRVHVPMSPTHPSTHQSSQDGESQSPVAQERP